MTQMLQAGCFALGLLLAGPAVAASYTESGVVPANIDYIGMGDLDPSFGFDFSPGGTYYFSYSFSRPATTLNAGHAYGLEYTCYEGGYGYQEIFECGEHHLGDLIYAASNTKSGHFSYTFPTGFDATYVESDGFTYGTTGNIFYLFGSYGLEFSGTEAVSYTIHVSDVPEPASWTMLIAGFGLTGAAMRRRGTKATITIA